MSGSGRKVVATVAEAVKGTIADMSKNRRGYTDVQGAPRFPIKLPVAFKSAVNQGWGEENASAMIKALELQGNVRVGHN